MTFVYCANAQVIPLKGTQVVTSTGALQYTVPVRVPAGRNGMQPQLSLTYDSSVGNGPLGAGWSLTGLGISMITRCPKTIAQDGVRAQIQWQISDSYCLDGRRLIPVQGVNGESGTEYRTEIEGFSKIISLGSYDFNAVTKGGPTYFEVKTKSGLTLSYGKLMLAPGTTSPGPDNPVRAWALHAVADEAGNDMSFSYVTTSDANQGRTVLRDDGVFYPSGIHYNNLGASNGHGAIVSLRYGVRTDAPIRYVAGYPLPRSDRVLEAIASSVRNESGTWQNFSQTTLYSKGDNDSYNLPRRIKTVRQCPDGCNTRLEFGWETQSTPFRFVGTSNGAPGTRTDYKNFFVDLDGTGKKYWIQLSEGADEAWIGSARPDGVMGPERWSRVAFPVGAASSFSHYFADINGDGKSDWIRVSKTTGEAWRALGLGAGNFNQPWTKYSGIVGPTSTSTHHFADMNGDGRADWMQNGPGPDGKWKHSVALATGDGNFQFWTSTIANNPEIGVIYADANGDGMADWISMTNDWGFYTALSKGDGTFDFRGGDYRLGGVKYAFGDFNGDGNIDALIFQSDRKVMKLYGKGDGKFADNLYDGDHILDGVNVIGDVDGDGLADRVVAKPGAPTLSEARLVLSNGGETPTVYRAFNLAPLGAGGSGANELYLADLTGDGRDDLIMVSVQFKQGYVGVSEAVTSGKIVSIRHDNAPPTLIDYQPISNASVYTPDSGAAYPMRDTFFPMPNIQRMPMVVAAVKAPNGIGGTLNTTYSYGGAKVDLTGRGLLGMRWNEAKLPSGITSRTEYRLDWPFSGLPQSSTISLSGAGSGGVLSKTTFSYGCMNFVSQECSTAVGRRYFPYQASTETSSWDLNGAKLPTTSISYVFDEFGNVTQKVSLTEGGLEARVDTVYDNNVNKWWLGRPTRVTETKRAP